MAIINTSKPTTSIENTARVNSVIEGVTKIYGVYWNDSRYLWDDTARSWADLGTGITNTSKPI